MAWNTIVEVLAWSGMRLVTAQEIEDEFVTSIELYALGKEVGTLLDIGWSHRFFLLLTKWGTDKVPGASLLNS